MCRLIPKIFGINIVLSLIFLLLGCDALFRGDNFNIDDNTVALQSIGFRLNDNTGATKDYGIEVASDQSELEIPIPYTASLTDPLTLYFTTNSNTIQVGEASGQSKNKLNGDPWVSEQTQLSFPTIHTIQSVRLLKTQPITGETTVTDYSLRIKKIIRPKLLNPDIFDELDSTENASLYFHIVDESGDQIENQEAGNWMSSRAFLWYDSLQFTVIDYPPLYDSVEQAFKLEIKPNVSGTSELFILNGAYEDENGITLYNTDSHPQDGATTGSLFSVAYKPPTVYLSFLGDDNNVGLIPSLPVKTWAKAKKLAESEGISNINVVASDSQPYDVAGEGAINYSGTESFWGNINGGWREDFLEQYSTTMASGEYPATIFFDSQQGSGTDNENPSSVFSYIITEEPPFQPSLKNITITVDSNQSDINNSTALFVSGKPSSLFTITLKNVVCQASNGNGGNSNGMIVKNANAKIIECNISGGDASSDSRAIFFKNAEQVSIEQSQIVGGNVSGSGSYGIEIDSPNGSFNINNSVVSGGNAESGDTYGIRLVAEGELNIMNTSTIVGGNAAGGTSTAIESMFGGILNSEDSIVLAGAQIGGVDPGIDENEVYGLNLENIKVTLNRMWVHSFSGKNLSASVKTTLSKDDFDQYSELPFVAKNSSFISGDATETTGIIFSDNAQSIPLPVFLQNSVISVGSSSTGGRSAGLHFPGSMKGYILNNTIHVKDAVGEASGILLEAKTWSSANETNEEELRLEIRNNLIYSDTTEKLYGIKSSIEIINYNYYSGRFVVHNNNFWDSTPAVVLQMAIGSGLPLPTTIEEYHMHAATDAADQSQPPNFLGNITQSVAIDMSYDYSSRDFSIGEIVANNMPKMPTDTVVGGENLDALKIDFYNNHDVEIITEDKQGNSRSGDGSLGWSMGAYEYDTVDLPLAVYVDTSGDDGAPLGTQEIPFASVSRAYEATQTIARNGITHIYVLPG